MAQITKAKRKTPTNYKFNKMANNQIRPREDNMKWPNVVWTRDEWAKSYKNMFKNISRKKLTQMQEYLLLLLENEMKRKKDPTQFFVEQSKVKKSYEIFEILLLFGNFLFDTQAAH